MFRNLWDLMSFALILGISLYIPLLFAFDIDSTQSHLIFFDLFLDIWFIVEIFLNFFTAFYDKGILVTSKRKIAFNYISTWFFVDLVSSIPFSFIQLAQLYGKEETFKRSAI